MSTPDERTPSPDAPDLAAGPTLAQSADRSTWDDGEDDPTDVADASPPAPSPPEPARYTFVREVGRGGIGRVLAVEDVRLRRVVARKDLIGGTAGGRVSRTQEQRFLREARLTGRLEHPGIVPVYDVGRDDDGRPYYTMRLVRGRSLADALAAAAGMADRLRLLGHFVDLCQAVAYANGQGVVHRDVKPANVMLGDYGETLLVDWGIAKRVGATEPAVKASRGRETLPGGTSHGAVLGTPAYMSPEQALGQHDEVGPASDVWSLGAVLFELLTGRPPFVGLSSKDVLRQSQAGRVRPVLWVEPGAPPELAAVADKALQTDPAARYASARDLAVDVEAFLTGHRVAAYGYSRWELFRRFVQNHRAAVAVALVAAVALAGVASGFYGEVLEERDRAVAASEEASSALAEAYVAGAIAAADQGNWLVAELYAAASLAEIEHPEARGVLARTGPVWKPELAASIPLPGGCLDLEVSPDGGAVACGGPAGAVLVDLGSGEVRTLATERTHAVAWGPHGDVVALKQRPRTVSLHGRDGAPLRAWVDGGVGRSVAISPDGAMVAYGDDTGVEMVPAAGGDPVAVAEVGGQVFDLSFSPDGVYVALAAQPGGAQVWRVVADGPWERVAEYAPHFGTATSVAFSPAGDAVLIGCYGNDAHVWEFATGVERFRLTGHVAPVFTVAWTADGRLATGSEDRTASVWSASDGRRLATIPAQEGWYAAVDLAADGSIITGSRAQELRVWRGPRDAQVQAHEAEGGVMAVAYDPDGRWVAGVTASGEVSVWAPTGVPQQRTRVPAPVRAAVVAPGGRLAVVDADRALWLVDPRTGEAATVAQLDREVSAIAYAGDALLVAGPRSGVDLFGQGAEAVGLPDTDGVLELAASADGRFVAGLSRERRIVVLDVASREVVGAVEVNPPGRAIALSPDGRLLAVAHRSEYTVGVWDWRAGEQVARLDGHTLQVSDISFSADGRWIATGSWDRTARVWDAQTGAAVAVLRGHAHHVSDTAFAADGQALVSGSWDGTARVWALDALKVTGAELLEDVRHRYGIALVGGVEAAVSAE